MKVVFIILGSISLVLGVLGIFLPLLPTTPFLLLSATLYMHSSPRLYEALLSHKYLGRYISDYKQKRGLRIKTKVVILSTLWLTMLYSIFFVVEESLWLQLLLLSIALGVTYHILTLKSLKK